MTGVTMSHLPILAQAKLENSDLILVVAVALLLLVLVGGWLAKRKPSRGGGGQGGAANGLPGAISGSTTSGGGTPGGGGTPEERQQRRREFDGMQRDLGKAMEEIETLARKLGDDLEAKSVRVESLLRQADERIAELRRLQEAAPGSGNGGGAASLPANAPQGNAGGGGAPASLAASTAGTPVASAGFGEQPTDQLSRDVYRLADTGLSSVDIARRLNEQIGKVELILALRRA